MPKRLRAVRHKIWRSPVSRHPLKQTVSRRSLSSLAALACLSLAACSGGPSGLPGFDAAAPQAQPAQPTGQTIGTGKVKVGLILPLTAEGQGRSSAIR